MKHDLPKTIMHFLPLSGCKCLCYAMVGLFPVRWLIYVMIAIRWTVNFCIYFFNRIFNGFGTPVAELSRTVTAFTIGMGMFMSFVYFMFFCCFFLFIFGKYWIYFCVFFSFAFVWECVDIDRYMILNAEFVISLIWK